MKRFFKEKTKLLSFSVFMLLVFISYRFVGGIFFPTEDSPTEKDNSKQASDFISG